MHLVEMQSEGFVEKAWEDHLAKTQDIDCRSTDNRPEDSSKSRKVNEMAGTFVLHAIFAGIAILMSLITRVVPKCRNAILGQSLKSMPLNTISSNRRMGPRMTSYANGHDHDMPEVEQTLRDMEETMQQRQAVMERTLQKIEWRQLETDDAFRARQDQLESHINKQMTTILEALKGDVSKGDVLKED